MRHRAPRLLLGCRTKDIRVCTLTDQRRLGELRAPWLRADSAKRDAGGPDRRAIQIESDCRRSQCEFVRRAISNLEIGRSLRVRRVGNEERGDDLAVLEIVLDVRRVSRQQMKIGGVHFPLALRAADRQHSIERGDGDRQIGRMRRDTGIRSA